MMRTILNFLICWALVLTATACGTKPKDLKGQDNFPASYPQE